MVKAKKRVPEGYHTITPHLAVRGGVQALAFYAKAFDAKELRRNYGPDGVSIMHAAVQIGDSMLMLHDEYPESGGSSPHSLEGTPVTMHLSVEDCDAWFKRAVAAGCTVEMELQDMFWGDRYGQLRDPFGHAWSIGSKLEDLTPDEIRQRAAEYFGES